MLRNIALTHTILLNDAVSMHALHGFKLYFVQNYEEFNINHTKPLQDRLVLRNQVYALQSQRTQFYYAEILARHVQNTKQILYPFKLTVYYIFIYFITLVKSVKRN